MDAEEENQSFVIKNNILIGKLSSSDVETTSISKLVLDSLTSTPDVIGQYDVDSGRKVTFAEMRERSVRCGLWLRKQGVVKDDVVCVVTPNCIDDYVPCLATLYVGAVYNPWYQELSASVARQFFELIQPKVMFASASCIAFLSKIANSLRIPCKFISYTVHPDFPDLSEILDQQTKDEVFDFRCAEIDEPRTRTAAIFFSSGTTGIQKGTALSYETVVNNRIKYMFTWRGARMLWYSSLSWITGTNHTTTAMRMGATRFVHESFEPEETARVVEKYKINWMLLTPSMLTEMWKAKVFERYDFSSLEVLLLTGSKPRADVLQEAQRALPHALVSNSYGMTELGGWVTRQTKRRNRIDSVGKIVELVQMKVVDTGTGRALGPNERGEICFKLRNYMLGYYGNPQETKKMIDDEGWLHTGDEGHYAPDGELTVTDRLKEVIIVRNHHVSPSEIEEILLRHPDVLEAAVVAARHETDVERPIAFVKLRPGAEVTAKELEELPVALGEYFRPSGGVIFVDRVPLTATGKKCIKEMKEMAKLYGSCCALQNGL